MILPVFTLDNDFTWSLWARSQEAPSNNIVFGNRYNPDGGEYVPREFIKFTSLMFEYHFNELPENVTVDGMPQDVWMHHVVVKDGPVLTYYKDNVVVGTTTVTGAPVNALPLYLGGQGSVESWLGQADEVALFERALTEAEVGRVYTLGQRGVSLAGDVVIPEEPDSFAISSITRDGASVNLAWPSEIGASYEVEFSPDLSVDSWMVISGEPIVATETTLTHSDTDPARTQGETGFYRIRMTPAP